MFLVIFYKPMEDILEKEPAIDWQEVTKGMNEKGFAIVPSFLSNGQCDGLVEAYDSPGLYRKTVVMERYRFGAGEYKYFKYPLPPLVQKIREKIYPKLVPIANLWMKVLNVDKQFPAKHTDLLGNCHQHGQLLPTALILKYGKGGYNTLHQDLYGEVYFPIQVVLFLDGPGRDYTGGEFVLVQQNPRAQSKAMVLNPGKGDMLIFTTNFRPVKGAKGYYRATMKHGVSEVHSGERHTLGVIFHDATS